MLCPSCNSDLKTIETLTTPTKNCRHFKCEVCGCKYYSKEVLVDNDDPEVTALFREWTKERGRKFRAKQKGENYDVKFNDGREAKPETKRRLKRLF